MSPVALVRPVSNTLANCALTHVPRRPIDAVRAARQHEQYVAVLRGLGCRIVEVARLDEAPDAVFVEDCAVVLDDVAVIGSMGIPSRCREVPSVAEALRAYRPQRSIVPPATLEGGDVLRIGRTLYVGRTARTNGVGIDQLRTIVEPLGYRVAPVDVSGCLHLKSACTPLPDGAVLLNAAWVDDQVFRDREIVRIDRAEPRAANVLTVGDTVLVAAGRPRTAVRLRERGYAVRELEVSELAKAEGELTCSSILLGA